MENVINVSREGVTQEQHATRREEGKTIEQALSNEQAVGRVCERGHTRHRSMGFTGGPACQSW